MPIVPRSLPPLLLLMALCTPLAATETRYVTDQHEFHLRAGESTRYRILRTLPSGTPLAVLDINQRTGYAHVRTEDGVTGYIMTRYLQEDPAAREALETMRERLEEIKQAPDQLAARLGELQSEYEQLSNAQRALQREKDLLEQELAEIRHASADVMRIDRERQDYQDKVAQLRVETDTLRQANLALSNRDHQQWFLIGAGTLVGGVLLGLILPNLRLRRRRSSWGSL
ncbi:MAG: TIGR04211 family SH3 domain-containing protein [Chromatiaceae bacterium]|nr:MAG: TIGR04211 family SH3 domain-containing protein [Chromatiaceae bacterium]